MSQQVYQYSSINPESGEEIWLVRIHAPCDPRGIGNRGKICFLCRPRDLVDLAKSKVNFDAVSMSDGYVAWHPFKSHLPEWLSEPMQRQIVLANKIIPELFPQPEYFI